MRDIAVEIPKPCSADWDAMTPQARSRFCAECSTRVHDLSSMTEKEAEGFLHDNADNDGLCVSYLEDGRGGIVFAQPKIVPARSLLRRIPVAAGFAAAMAACSPAAEVCEDDAPAAAAIETIETPETPETPQTPAVAPETNTRSLLAHPEDAVTDAPPERALAPDEPDEPCDGGFSEQPPAPTTTKTTPPPIHRTAGKPVIRKMGKRKAPTPRP